MTSLQRLNNSLQNPVWRFCSPPACSAFAPFFVHSPQRRPLGLDRILDDLDLLRDGRQLVLLEAVELVKAAPSTALVESYQTTQTADVWSDMYGARFSRYMSVVCAIQKMCLAYSFPER